MKKLHFLLTAIIVLPSFLLFPNVITAQSPSFTITNPTSSSQVQVNSPATVQWTISPQPTQGEFQVFVNNQFYLSVPYGSSGAYWVGQTTPGQVTIFNLV